MEFSLVWMTMLWFYFIYKNLVLFSFGRNIFLIINYLHKQMVLNLYNWYRSLPDLFLPDLAKVTSQAIITLAKQLGLMS